MLSMRLMATLAAVLGFFFVSGTALSQDASQAGASLPGQGVFEAASSTDASYNWAGYAADRGEYTAVSATWVVPSVSTDAPLAADATWVGVGGVDTSDLIQAGTQALVQNDGTTQYEAWYETLPRASQAVSLTVSPGDSVSVALTYLGTHEWSVSFVDNTSGKSYNTTVAYDSSFSSAEWVQEMPSLAGAAHGRGRGSLIPLDDFGSLSFSHASTVKNGQAEGPEDAGAQPLRMVSAAGETLATPSTLSQDGGFTVMRNDATAVAATPQRLRVLYVQF